MGEHLETKNPHTHETHISHNHGGVITQHGIDYAITADAQHIIPIPKNVASKITLALRVQDKIDTGAYPQLTSLVSMLNCRKTVFVAQDNMDLKDAIENKEDIHGVTHLYQDVMRLQKQGYRALRVPHIMEDLEKALEKYQGSFPCVVHIFEANTESTYYKSLKTSLDSNSDIDLSMLKKINRIHSFIVLGQDEEFICFQKRGAHINQPFEIVTLSHACVFLHTSLQRDRIVFLGPLAENDTCLKTT